MKIKKRVPITIAGLIVMGSGLLMSHAQEDASKEQEFAVEHPECLYFHPNFRETAAVHSGSSDADASPGVLTEQVRSRMASVGRIGIKAFQSSDQLGTIDKYLFADMQAAGVTPADLTTDWEFIRRASLDFTGRIPTPERVLSFVNDSAPNKRLKLIDELLNAPEWVDKWTMYFGDLYKNNADIPSSGTRRFAQGRNAFYKWIHDSLANNKPYNQMASELISAQGENSWTNGALNWLVGGRVTGGPAQDITDQQAANIAETFLGIAHMNCLLCHNGRGHLDALSLWGKQSTRYMAWQFASFLSHTSLATVRPDPNNRNLYYWNVTYNPKARDYTLGTTTGNRPARTIVNNERYLPPVYPFSGNGPNPGENYQVALAREITSDFQFARATVNYIWKEFFGRGIVDPPNQFDPARLDPDNPPSDPGWSLQPSNARLLNGLAQEFVDSGYSLKTLMRKIGNSQAYQLSSCYDGEWNTAWDKLFARKFVRRLWAEELHDAIAQSSGIIPSYRIAGGDQGAMITVNWAMQFPETVNLPDSSNGGPVSTFLDAFLRGNRDDNPRKSEGSILQALDLMNDNFVMSRISGRTAMTGLLGKSMNVGYEQQVNMLYLNVLSRYPTQTELSAALASLQSGDRLQRAQNLLWSLYNKVDFIFNY